MTPQALIDAIDEPPPRSEAARRLLGQRAGLESLRAVWIFVAIGTAMAILIGVVQAARTPYLQNILPAALGMPALFVALLAGPLSLKVLSDRRDARDLATRGVKTIGRVDWTRPRSYWRRQLPTASVAIVTPDGRPHTVLAHGQGLGSLAPGHLLPVLVAPKGEKLLAAVVVDRYVHVVDWVTQGHHG